MKLRMIVDIAMTVLLMCQMAWLLIGETAHEWTGSALFGLFIGHHVLNRRWLGSLFKGKYRPARILQTAVNILILAAMIGLMISGVMMSRTVFAFLPVEKGMSMARLLHMVCAYWGFCLMGLHAGFHWNMVLNMADRSRQRKTGLVRRPEVMAGAAALIVCAAGIFAFIRNNILDYMLLRTQFVFFETDQPLILFFAQYLAMFGMWICAGYYGMKLLRRR